MESLLKKLETQIQKTKSHLCVGLDPAFFGQEVYEKEISEHGAEAFLCLWGHTVLSAAKDQVPAVKFQSAFYEQFGVEGFIALQKSIAFARDLGFFVILDAKRGDISSSMKAYGKSSFEYFCADALTVTPYMGTDVIEPLVPWLKKNHALFVVWVTSNASASNLQFASTKDVPFSDLVYSEIRNYAQKEKIASQVGFVFGATKMSTAKPPKDEMLLIPGIGAQGGKVDQDLKQLLKDNPVSIYNVSRGITDMDWKGQIFDRNTFFDHCHAKIGHFK